MGDWNCTPRLALGCWQPEQPDRLQRLTDAAGWWRSGDRARLRPASRFWGDWIRPCIPVERPFSGTARTTPAAARAAGLAVDAVLLLGVLILSGERLVALVRLEDAGLLEEFAAAHPGLAAGGTAAALVVVSGAGPDGSRQMATAALAPLVRAAGCGRGLRPPASVRSHPAGHSVGGCPDRWPRDATAAGTC